MFRVLRKMIDGMERTTGCSRRSVVVVCAMVGCLFGLVACQATDARLRSADRGVGIPRGQAGFALGMVATSEAEPAEAAARVLERGGNAIDAAAVAQFMLNVVEPQSSGIGGGGFMMIYLAGPKQTIIVDSRETAPAAATPRMFLDGSGQPVPLALASTSGYAVGVPGTLRGIEAALARWGTISLADALAPAIEAAENGIAVNPRLARAAEDARLRSECDADPGNSPYDAARVVFRPAGDHAACGNPVAAGNLLVQPDLARTFRLIAAAGAGALYDCDHPAGIARSIVATQRATRADNPDGAGQMTCDDLSGYRAAFREPVVGHYRGYLVRSAPPPSSGGLALVQMLKMLERFPMGDSARGFGFGAFSTLNVMQESMRLAFADRAVWMGDTDVVRDLPIDGLTDDDYLESRADSCPRGDPSDQFYCIAAGARLAEVQAGDPRRFEGDAIAAPRPRRARVSLEQEEAHTTHITIVDNQGNIVSYTTTIESPWGTGLMVPGFGFMLNNEMTDFNLVPQRRGEPADADFDPGANDVAPLKRPRSSMAPTILFARGEEGERPIAAFGTPGGATIINTLLNFTIDLIDHRLPVREAVEWPRISVTKAAYNATTSVEAGFDAGVLDRLRAIGYRFRREPAVIGAVQAVVIDPRTGMIYGDADPRRDGVVVGLPLDVGTP
jgi:gamma-glutamyltranspeptidase/glutathione hydrolase